jgi:hypothetical protein
MATVCFESEAEHCIAFAQCYAVAISTAEGYSGVLWARMALGARPARTWRSLRQYRRLARKEESSEESGFGVSAKRVQCTSSLPYSESEFESWKGLRVKCMGGRIEFLLRAKVGGDDLVMCVRRLARDWLVLLASAHRQHSQKPPAEMGKRGNHLILVNRPIRIHKPHLAEQHSIRQATTTYFNLKFYYHYENAILVN